MLVVLVFCFVWFIFVCFWDLSFSLSVGILVIVLLASFFSFYSCLLGNSFVSMYGESDVFSSCLISLTVWLTCMMFLASMEYWYLGRFSYFFSLVVFILMVCVICFFLVDSFLLLYVFFEASLLPTFVLILNWGYQPERLQASLYFVMYTISASLPFLFIVLLLWFNLGSLYMVMVSPFGGFSSCSFLFYLGLVFAFLVKVPMWGVHLWLPKAHVEAPVSGSMILAGILLKLGGYGLMKICLCFLFLGSSLWSFLLSVNLWGSLVIGVVCFCSMDVKVVIAYSSIIHMGLMVLGFLSGGVFGCLGSKLMMISHGFSSSGLFFVANFNYGASSTRSLIFHKGLGFLYPMGAVFWFFLLAANMGAPPTLNLVSEVMISVSVVKLGYGLFSLVLGFTFLSAVYNLYLYSVQQGSVGLYLFPSGVFTSCFVLSCLLHIFPVYLSVLVVYVFCLF